MLHSKRLRCSAGVYQLDPNYMHTIDRIADKLDDLARKYDLAQGTRLSRPRGNGEATGRRSAIQKIVPNTFELSIDLTELKTTSYHL